jgi:hypothetical protein
MLEEGCHEVVVKEREERCEVKRSYEEDERR